MLMEVKNSIRFFFNAIKTGIKSAMAYKTSFIIQTVFMAINNFFFLLFWLIVFRNTGKNSGITFDNILYIWSFSTISYGIAYFFFGGVQKINEYIINGSMDSFLIQPKNVLVNVITSKTNFSACGDIIYGIVIGLFAVGFSIDKFILLFIIGCFGSIFFLSTEILFRSLSVWLGDTEIIANKYIETLLITFSTYPENIFGIGIKIILYTVVPVAYLSYLPANILNCFNLLKLLTVFGVGILYLALSKLVFNKAMKSYESGNNIAMKN